MKKRILIDATTVIDKVDGLSTYIINFIKYLPKESFDSFTYIILIRQDLVRKELTSLIEIDKFEIIKVKTASIGPRREWDMFWFLRKNKKSFDLFHSMSNYYPFFLKGGIATVHDITFRKYFNASRWTFNLAPRFLSIITKNGLRKADAIIAVSDFTKNDIISSFKLKDKIKKKINVIHEGWEHLKPSQGCIEIKEAFAGYSDYLFYVGTTRLHKNMKNLLKAFVIAKDNLPGNVKIVVSGNASYLDDEDKKSIAMINGNGERIIFTGFVSKNSLEQLFKNSDAFIFPSLSEGFGIPVLESFYFEKPLLCSNTTSLPEIAGDAALYFDPEDPRSIAKTMITFYTDDTLRSILIANGKKRLKLFSWEKMAKEIINLYKRLLNE